jgi:PAS domain S-box-containing protein
MKRLRELPLVSQLILVTLILGAVTALAGAWVLRASARDAIREQVQARNVGIAQRLATGMDDRLEADVELLKLLATNEKIARVRQSAQTELYVALRARPLSHLTLFDERGHVVAAAAENQLLVPSEQMNRPELVARLETESEILDILPADVPTIEISVPVEQPPGVVRGALSLQIVLEDAAARLDARLLDPDVTAFLVGEEGRVLVHPERDRVIRRESFDVSSLLSSKTRTESATAHGERVLAAIAETTTFPGYVVVQEPESTAFASAGQTATQLTLILLLAVLAIVAGVSLLGRNLLHPLRGLQEAVDSLGRGELEERVPETGGREVRALAADFNQMADALQDQIDELATSEKRLHAILDNTTAIIYLKDPGGRYLFVNSQFEKRFGLSRQKMLGKTDHDVFPNHLAAVYRANDAAVMESGAVMEREEIAEVGGEKHTYISVKFPLFDSAQRLYGVCGISTDITERKKVEAYQRQLEESRRRRMQALEINDNVIQGLAVALYSLDLRRPAEAQKALEETLAAARSIINDLLEDSPEEWGPGDFIRSEAAEIEVSHSPMPQEQPPA